MKPKDARLRLGFTVNQMAFAMGVHRQTWIKWEREEQNPSASTMRLILVLLWLQEKGLLVKCVKNVGNPY
jgi:DNA-binding XRE family transcriptional regulator